MEPVRLTSSSPFLRSKQIKDVQKVKNGQLDKKNGKNNFVAPKMTPPDPAVSLNWT